MSRFGWMVLQQLAFLSNNLNIFAVKVKRVLKIGIFYNWKIKKIEWRLIMLVKRTNRKLTVEENTVGTAMQEFGLSIPIPVRYWENIFFIQNFYYQSKR